MLAICILWLTNCTSTRTPGSSTTPKYYPPDPYDETGALIWEYDAERDAVIVPYWFWEKVFDYIANTQAGQKIAE